MNKSRIVNILGTILTPFLLVSIAAIVLFAFLKGGAPEMGSIDSWQAFSNGFFQGYQTMDLLAAFFFSQFVITHLSSQKTELNVFFKAALLGAFILSTVYCLLVTLGWNYSHMLQGVPPQEMLGMIALKALGAYAAPVVCIAVIFACLTTSIVLASLFSDFLRIKVARDKMNNSVSLLITLTIGFLVSTLEFSGIAAFICPVLETIYPMLVVLTLVNIGWAYMKKPAVA